MPEFCIGCGTEGRMPVVAVMRDGDDWSAQPVCSACWRDPAHRKAPIKAHFFQRHEAAQALAHAGSSSIGGSL